MNTKTARKLGNRIASQVRVGDIPGAEKLIAPVLVERVPFRLLDKIGAPIGDEYIIHTNEFMNCVADHHAIGGWVIIGSILRVQLDRDLEGSLDRCRRFVIIARSWHGSDSLGERVPGPSWLAYFKPTYDLLRTWYDDKNRWVRRSLGVSVHFWAKRTQGDIQNNPQAKELIAFLGNLFEERDMDAVKGIGWGLKTLGRYYPNLTSEWLHEQIVVRNRKPRPLMLRKAMTYLTKDQRSHAVG